MSFVLTCFLQWCIFASITFIVAYAIMCYKYKDPRRDLHRSLKVIELNFSTKRGEVFGVVERVHKSAKKGKREFLRIGNRSKQD